MSDSHPPRTTPAVRAVIATMVAVLVLRWALVPERALIAWLGLEADTVARWWTVLTYPLVHPSAWSLALNALALALFGPRLEHAWGTRRVAWFLVWCTLGGACTSAPPKSRPPTSTQA